MTVTRAKVKCIVFISRPLMEPTFDVLMNEDATEGMNHMINPRRFCERNGDVQSFPTSFVSGGAGAEITVYRGRVKNLKQIRRQLYEAVPF